MLFPEVSDNIESEAPPPPKENEITESLLELDEEWAIAPPPPDEKIVNKKVNEEILMNLSMEKVLILKIEKWGWMIIIYRDNTLP